jgi:hypothetical protein
VQNVDRVARHCRPRVQDMPVRLVRLRVLAPAVVSVDDPIARGDGFTPRDVWIPRLAFLRHPIGGFADDLDDLSKRAAGPGLR